jgi:dihydroorotate dehydrogenase (NAD+) catalytic subunit
MPEIRVDLQLPSPWLNAAGTLGYAPGKPWPFDAPQGAFVTNPVSLKPRTPAGNRCLLPYAGGFLLHTGLPNPGLKAVIRRYRARWQRAAVDTWVHILPGTPQEAAEMVRLLEECEGVTAVELSLPADISQEEALELVGAASGELPLIVEIDPGMVNVPWLAKLADLGVSAMCLGAPRGVMPDVNGNRVGGRLYGPALLPQTLYALQMVLPIGLPVIASGGIYRKEDGELLLTAGAWTVKVDAVLWRGNGGEEKMD